MTESVSHSVTESVLQETHVSKVILEVIHYSIFVDYEKVSLTTVIENSFNNHEVIFLNKL